MEEDNIKMETHPILIYPEGYGSVEIGDDTVYKSDFHSPQNVENKSFVMKENNQKGKEEKKPRKVERDDTLLEMRRMRKIVEKHNIMMREISELRKRKERINEPNQKEEMRMTNEEVVQFISDLMKENDDFKRDIGLEQFDSFFLKVKLETTEKHLLREQKRLSEFKKQLNSKTIEAKNIRNELFRTRMELNDANFEIIRSQEREMLLFDALYETIQILGHHGISQFGPKANLFFEKNRKENEEYEKMNKENYY